MDRWKDIKCVHFKGTGEINYDYLIKKILEVNNHPDFDFTFNTFIDFEDAIVSAQQGGFEKYQEFFRGLQKLTGRRRWAIYSRNIETLRNANMAHLLESDKIEVDVFEIKEQALSYFGIKEEYLFDNT